MKSQHPFLFSNSKTGAVQFVEADVVLGKRNRVPKEDYLEIVKDSQYKESDFSCGHKSSILGIFVKRKAIFGETKHTGIGWYV